MFSKRLLYSGLCSLMLYALAACSQSVLRPAQARMERIPDNASVSDICEDVDGYLWMGTTRFGLYRYDGTSYLHFLPSREEGSLHSMSITKLYSSRDGTLWVGTEDGLFAYDVNSARFTAVGLGKWGQSVRDIFEDRSGRLYVVTNTSVVCSKPGEASFDDGIGIGDPYFAGAFADLEGRLWLFTGHRARSFEAGSFRELSSLETSGSQPIISAMYNGTDEVLVTSNPDLLCFDLRSGRFSPVSGALNALYHKRLHHFSHPGNGLLYCVAENELYRYDYVSEELSRAGEASFPYYQSRECEGANDIFAARDGNIWVAPHRGEPVLWENREGDALSPLRFHLREHDAKDIVALGDNLWYIEDSYFLARFDCKSGALDRWDIGTLTGGFLDSDRDCRLSLDGRQRGGLIVSVDNLLFAFDCIGGELRRTVTAFGPNISSYLEAAADQNGGLWAGDETGALLYLSPRFKMTGLFSLSPFGFAVETRGRRVSKMLTLSSGDIAVAYSWLGIGIVNPRTFQSRLLPLSPGNEMHLVSALCEDTKGRLWVGTDSDGLFVYDLQQEDRVVHPSAISRKRIEALYPIEGDRMLMVADGVVYFCDLDAEEFAPLMTGPSRTGRIGCCFFPFRGETALYMNGSIFQFSRNRSLAGRAQEKMEAWIFDASGTLVRRLGSEELSSGKARVTMGDRNGGSVLLTTPAFSYHDHLIFHLLPRRHQGWQESLQTAFIPLNGLSFGNNPVKVEILDAFLQDKALHASMQVHVKSPWYISTPAVLLYILALSLLLFILFRLLKELEQKRISAQVAQKELQLQEAMNRDNMDFFANISHEFRTPLTILSGATDTLLKDSSASVQQMRLLHAMKRNIGRMLKIVSQILDFNKLEHNKMRLYVKVTDVSQILSTLSDTFSHAAGEKRISLQTDCETPLLAWVDEDLFEKIMYNLLSNALKYTPAGGAVEVSAVLTGADAVRERFGETATPGNYLMVDVKDNGIGVPPEKREEIFARFARLDATQRVKGTGIGLYFTREIVKAHHGWIAVGDNNQEGDGRPGADFFFVLPADSALYSEEERRNTAEDTSSVAVDAKRYLAETRNLQIPTVETADMQKILLIDDDSEVLYFLRLLLSPSYKIVYSMDAMGGYALIEQEHPDLIISDVMMVETDGIQLCRMVKDNADMCHIPVILLTAKSTKSDQLTGLEAGAEAYIVKPFDADYLKAVIHTLLQNRANMHKSLSEHTSVASNSETETLSRKDREFMDRLYGAMEESIMDSTLDVDRISAGLFISRTKFFYKVKGLTGMTPGEFFKVYKLNRAAQLIREDKYKLSAIADMVGFSSPAHFSSAFKKQFGVLPSEY